MKFFDRRKLADAAASSLHAVCDSVTVYLLHLSGAPVAGLVCEITFPPPTLLPGLAVSACSRAQVLEEFWRSCLYPRFI